jgi:uncharacterized membrane protein
MSNNIKPISRLLHSDAFQRILQTSLKGALLFFAIAEGGLAVWPWFYALPHVSFWYLWPLLGANPIALLWFGLAGLIFGGLVGIPRRWWWSLAISTGLDLLLLVGFVVYTVVVSISYYSITHIFDSLLTNLPLQEGFYILITCILCGLVRAGTQLPRRINPSHKNSRMIAEIASIGLLIGIGFLITLPFAMLDKSPDVEILSVYETAQANGWKIQSLTFGGLVGESLTGVRIHLWDGRTYNCAYQEQVGMYYDDMNKIDVMDALICPP